MAVSLSAPRISGPAALDAPWAEEQVGLVAPPGEALLEREQHMAEARAAADRPQPCLLHEDIHPHGRDCVRAYTRWLAEGQHRYGRAADDAYALEVEQRILNRLIREHAPAHTRRRITPL